MTDITIYDTAGGEILSNLTLFGATSIEAQCGAGQAWLRGHYDPRRYRVINGHLIKRSAQELRDLDLPRRQAEIRTRARQLLKDSDWRVGPDGPSDKSGWITYRAQLRQILNTQIDPDTFQWPARP
jgi:hypothetical protein